MTTQYWLNQFERTSRGRSDVNNVIATSNDEVLPLVEDALTRPCQITSFLTRILQFIFLKYHILVYSILIFIKLFSSTKKMLQKVMILLGGLI